MFRVEDFLNRDQKTVQNIVFKIVPFEHLNRMSSWICKNDFKFGKHPSPSFIEIIGTVGVL